MQLANSLTIGIFERLLLFGRLRDDLDAFAVKDTNVLAIAIKHFYREHKMLPLVGIGNE